MQGYGVCGCALAWRRHPPPQKLWKDLEPRLGGSASE